MSDVLRKFRRDLGVPLIQLPGQRRLLGGKDLNGSIWVQIEGQDRITMPPKQAIEFAIGLLKAAGIQLEQVNTDELVDG
jgi:hypothetical protein